MHAGGADVTAGRSPLIKGDRPGVDGRVNLIEGKCNRARAFLVSVLSMLQALVLVFAVLVQVAIVGQWFYGEPPAVIQVQQQQQQQATGQSSTTSITSCRTPLGQIVASLG